MLAVVTWRGLVVAALLSIASLSPRSGNADEKAPPPAPADDAAFQKRVADAIDRGVAWLVKQQGAGGHWPVHPDRAHTALGEQAFVVFTLAKCGVDTGHPTVAKGLAHVESLLPQVPLDTAPGWLHARTYAQAAVLLMHDALYGKPPKPGAKETPRYAGRSPRNPCRYPREALERIQAIVDWLALTQAPGGWRYPGPAAEPEVIEDISCTQLALLALQAASRCGLEAPVEVYKRALAYLLDTQQKDGPEVENWVENPAWTPGPENRYPRFVAAGKARARGWGYARGWATTGGMTAAGLGSLSIVKDRLRALGGLDAETTRRIDRALVDGLAWLGRNFDVTRNPGADGYQYYYLYGLERVGSLLGLRFVAQHDWYREGAEHLLQAQERDGGWPSQPAGAAQSRTHHDRVLQTCFALLFLKRATPAPFQPLGPVVTGD